MAAVAHNHWAGMKTKASGGGGEGDGIQDFTRVQESGREDQSRCGIGERQRGICWVSLTVSSISEQVQSRKIMAMDKEQDICGYARHGKGDNGR